LRATLGRGSPPQLHVALNVHEPSDMFSKLKKNWRAFKLSPVGRRFQIVHERQAHRPAWVKALMINGAFAAFGVGVVLTVLPGPAVVFFAVAGALAAAESAWVARNLDRAEVAVRKRIARLRHRRAKPTRVAD
jgi:hypothetical protein